MSDEEAVSPAPYHPIPPVAVTPHEDTITGAPPATSTDIGGQINPDTFLGVRVVGPFAGMLLANNPGDPGIEEGVEAGLIIPAVPGDTGEAPAPRVPVISSISPDSAPYTVAEFTIDVLGSNFADGDSVYSDDLEASSVAFVNEGQLTATFTGVVVESPRSVDITVDTGEETSAGVAFTFADTVAGGE